MSYIDKFLKLRCAGDVLEAVYPLRDPEEEISRSMELIAAIKGKILKERGQWTVIDLCAGTPLSAIIAAHLLPVLHTVAADKRNRMREGFGKVRKFGYEAKQDTLSTAFWEHVSRLGRCIILATHADGALALRIAVECKGRNFPMAIVPCSVGMEELPTGCNKQIARKVGVYNVWLTYLMQQAGASAKCYYGPPCNGLVTRGL